MATVVDRRILEALLETELARRPGHRLVLVHGSYDPASPARFAVRIGDEQRRIEVTDQPSVLGVVDAWQRHRHGDGTGTLVITTTAPTGQLGWDLRAHALGRTTLTVSLDEIIRRRFGAAEIDPRIRKSAWLVEALLAAEPAGGWRESGATAEWRRSGGRLLSLDAAVRALVEARFGMGRALDLDALLAWSRSPAGPARFLELGEREREGLTEWLRRNVGEATGVLLSLVVDGRATDAMALGIIGAVLTDPGAPQNATLAVGGLFGPVATRSEEHLKAFSTAVQGTLARWISEAETDRSERQEAQGRVRAVLERADDLARAAGIGAALGGNPFLPSGLTARLHALADALGRDTAAAEAALRELSAHRLAELHRDRVEVARMAVRIRRWLDSDPDLAVPSVAAGVRNHLTSWGWVDRALALLWTGDPASDPVAWRAYHALIAEARARRAELDERFADRVVSWAAHAQSVASGGCLLIEDVLKEVARPLCTARPPLVLVLDGMSSAVAAELGAELGRGGWLEVSAAQGARRAAVAMIPSLTRISRASLLGGEPAAGGQNVEAAGFAAFWKRHRREGLLFHKADIAGTAGQRLAQPLMDALAGDAVVGAVLNTIDDALDHGRAQATWRLSDIAHLTELLNAARAYGRPVVIVSDHGHVLDRNDRPPAPGGTGSARWRTGAPGAGEVSVTGPRVLEGGGTVTVPWQEEIRYTPRKDGYHGGVSLAELTVPVLTVLPSADLMPSGWSVLSPEAVTPRWWNSGTSGAAQASFTYEPRAEGPLFDVRAGLGRQVVASERYAGQKRFVRRAPDRDQVAAVIDALAGADGNRMSPAAVASAAGGRPPRDAALFVTALERLLNVEGYPVLGLIDAGRTVRLDVDLLREQFGV
ncbi:BREX-2 system phosphatase PglZ [Actinomadura craniellae]|uniref:BREX-2 system phosphatase PglZ n=1 Tax=Actinomadura craniellae TaxID=2231787 RepID=A0A365H194_9ACTN|nr:BREX-2 system phosphatase PglZ [Actinomadura craniellae]RAY12850.1 BREX-2 system phosphatase PglZ [Actinomadura craniellae]